MIVIKSPTSGERLQLTEDQKKELGGHIMVEVTDALSSRFYIERSWRELLRMYEGVPKNPTRVQALPNMPTLEVTIGAIACDTIYSQVLDLIFSINPLVTVRSTNADPDNVEDAKALQEFANRVAEEIKIRDAAEEVFLDNVQLGTGIYYTPWVEDVRKTRGYQIRSAGPKAYYMAVENFLVPNISRSDPQESPWVGFRFWLTEGELKLRARANPTWDIEEVTPAGDTDWVRNRRETLGRQSGQATRKGRLYEIWDIYMLYDIDGDGIEEDLYVVWDRTSQSVIDCTYNNYDKRPGSIMRYQRRAGLAYGLGIMEMLRPYQEEITDVHVHRTVNMMLCNARIWKVRSGLLPGNFRAIPGRVVQLDDPESFKGEQMADIYPSSAQAEAITLSLSERRVGVNDLSQPRPSQVLGSRTPGITALSLLQQSSKRFTSAFDGMRMGTADAVVQGVYRYNEKVLEGDQAVIAHVLEVMGAQYGERVIALLSKPDFMRNKEVTMTASSASINKEADRQASLMLMNMLGQYYQKTVELVTISANPMVPPQVREVASRIAKIIGEAVDRTIRTFDQVRDPQTFVVQVADLVDQEQVQPDALAQLLAMMQQGGGGGDVGSGGGEQPPSAEGLPS